MLSSSAVETVKFISEEAARRKLHARILKARADVEKKLPRSKRKRVIKPWISGGSEVRAAQQPLLNDVLLHRHACCCTLAVYPNEKMQVITVNDHKPYCKQAAWICS